MEFCVITSRTRQFDTPTEQAYWSPESEHVIDKSRKVIDPHYLCYLLSSLLSFLSLNSVPLV